MTKTRATTLIAVARTLGEFTLAELTVAAWRADPRRFVLRGFEAEHPDTKVVAVELYRKTGAFAKAAEKVRDGVWRVRAAP